MANEAQYYHPIIQAMIAAQNQNQERARLQQAAEQHKADRGIREHQLELQSTRDKNEFEHQKGMAKIAAKQLESQLEMASIDKRKKLYDLSEGGVDVQKDFPQLAAGIPNAEEILKNITARTQGQAQAQTTGQMTAAEPFKAADDQRSLQNQQTLLTQQQEFKTADQERDFTNKLKLASVDQGYARELQDIVTKRGESLAHINGKYHLMGSAAVQRIGLGNQVEQAKQLLEGIYTGNIDHKALTVDQKRLVDTYAAGTGDLKSIPSDGKAYAKKLDSVSSIDKLISQYEDLALNYSRDSEGAWKGGNQTLNIPLYGTAQRTQPGSDLESKSGSMKATLGQLASFFDLENRKSDMDIVRQAVGAFDPKSTKEQNLEKLKKHKDKINQIVKNTFVGMSPERVDAVLEARGIANLNPSKKTVAYEQIRKSPDGKDSIGYRSGKWYKVETGEEIK